MLNIKYVIIFPSGLKPVEKNIDSTSDGRRNKFINSEETKMSDLLLRHKKDNSKWQKMKRTIEEIADIRTSGRVIESGWRFECSNVGFGVGDA